MPEFVQDDVAVLGVVRPTITEEELSLPGNRAAKVVRVVGTAEGMRIAGKLIVDETPRAGIAEGEQILLRAVELEIRIDLLELRLTAVEEQWLRSVGRFAINSTLGIGGLFDVATRFKLRSDLTGFSATLARWGMHPGPFLVIPLLGPSTLRDGVGLLTDYGVSYEINVADLYRGDQAWALGVLDPINLRANNDFRYYSSGSPFEYETIRFLYVHRELIEDEALHAKAPRTMHDPDEPAGR